MLTGLIYNAVSWYSSIDIALTSFEHAFPFSRENGLVKGRGGEHRVNYSIFFRPRVGDNENGRGARRKHPSRNLITQFILPPSSRPFASTKTWSVHTGHAKKNKNTEFWSPNSSTFQ